MLFNSFEFIFGFLPASLLIFYAIGSLDRKLATLWLAVCSIFFYACWNYRMTALLLASVAFNYLCAFLIHRCSKNRYLQNAILIFGILVDLGVLIFYKYLSALIFFLEENGVVTAGTKFEILLPLGISFFTFTQIGFLIDVRQRVAKYRGPVSYVAFVTFFPHLIAGPILHNREILPQFEDPRMGRFSAENIALGLSYFAIGLMKKILIADNLAGIADNGFAHPHALDLLGAWGVTLAYTFQLYFDFSGYSDMAIALARMFGIIFPANFNSPYKATSIIDFWQRWHMTLTRYLMLYVYNPIGDLGGAQAGGTVPNGPGGPRIGRGICPTGRVSHHGCDGLSRCLARCRTSISYFWRHAWKLSVHQSCMANFRSATTQKGSGEGCGKKSDCHRIKVCIDVFVGIGGLDIVQSGLSI